MIQRRQYNWSLRMENLMDIKGQVMACQSSHWIVCLFRPQSNGYEAVMCLKRQGN